MAIKQPAETSVVPNPLHKYASYTYSWSLWWLDVNDFNQLMAKDDVGPALAWNPGPKSYVLAEDGGLYPGRRHPATLGLNYNIQNVEFTTAIGPNQVSKSSNLQTGSMTIIEPYGVTFIDSLVACSFDGTQFVNYLMHPLMLQLEFKGYDDKGNMIPSSQMVTYRKRFPIVIKNMKLSVTGKGAEYRIAFAPASAQGLDPEFEKTPEEFTIDAGTVQEFFDAFSAKYLIHQAGQVGTARVEYGDSIKFDIDPTIAESKIVYDKELPLKLANPDGNGISLSKSSFVIPKGTSILDVITRVMSHSSYLINLQLGLEDSIGGPVGPKDQTAIFNAFKTQSAVEYAGVDSAGVERKGVYDTRRTRRPIKITYKIHQYPTWNGGNPNVPLFPDSQPHTVKEYNYLYTGQNIDIIDFKLDFNTTYHTAINTYNSQFSAQQSSENTSKNIKASNTGKLSLSPSSLAAIFVPQLKLVPSVTPMRYKHIIGDANATAGMNVKDRPSAQVAADVLQSIYSAPPSGGNGMITVPLTIVGDPTLIKQDDWLYIPSPVKATEYNSWNSQTQAEFVAKHGHIRMDAGQIVVSLTVNTPLDIDADITNQGLVYPQPRTRPALFSGQYYIQKIVSKFQTGKFEQVLTLNRFINTDYNQAYSQKKPAERAMENGDADAQEGGFYGNGSGANNDLKLVPTNTSTAAGDGAATDPAVDYGGSDNTREQSGT
jgi:hypothetical protein